MPEIDGQERQNHNQQFQERVWIDSNEKLHDCCSVLRAASAVAVDTEFMRTDTFYPIAALVQISNGINSYLIDPLEINNFDPLIELFQNQSVVKVFHACSEDLEVFNHFLECIPSPLVDTQIAAGLLNYGSSLGYASLVNELLGVELEKGETRSNWLKRPLAEKQCAYAMDDVLYLLDVYQKLISELKEKDRLHWFEEECEVLLQSANEPVQPAEYFRRIKSAWKLSRKDLSVLKSLSEWRENKARDKNLPRNHVLHERVIFELAMQKPTEHADLRNIKDFHSRKINEYGEAVLSIISNSLDVEESEWPDRLPSPLPSSQKNLMKSLKAKVLEVAEQIDLSPEVMAKKADYEFIVRSGMTGGEYELPPRMKGWRFSVVGKPLLAVVKGE
ncbi:MAG: ribonuclease D [Cellvibrionaceae bacterium]